MIHLSLCKDTKAQVKINLELLKDIKAKIKDIRVQIKVNLALLKDIKA